MPEPAVTVHLERRGAIALVTLDNVARRNALSPPVRDGLLASLRAAVDDPDVRAIVLTGAGGHFCAGGDISNMGSAPPFPANRRRFAALHEVVRLMVSGPKPVVAAVEGVAFGAGFSLALAADTIIASSQARFCASFGRINLLADCGMLWTLPQRVGMHQARRLIAQSVELDASEAARLGVVDGVVEAGQALARALQEAARLSELAPGAYAVTKAVFADGSLGSLEGALRAELDHQSTLRTTEDHRNAIQAFLEKRKIVFSGK